MTEIFKHVEIPEFKDFYQVSNLGNIKSMRNNKNLSTKSLRGGYPSVGLSNGQINKTFKVHILVANTFMIDNKPKSTKRLIVNHKDGNKVNFKLDNLEWLTESGNVRHAYETG